MSGLTILFYGFLGDVWGYPILTHLHMMNGLTNFKGHHRSGGKRSGWSWHQWFEMIQLCSSQPARDWKSFFSFFHFEHIFFGLKIIIPLFIPVKFLHFFFIPVVLPFGIFIFLSFASKRVLGPWELPPGAFSRTVFVSFHVVSFLYCFGYFSFLCLENWHWKLSKSVFSRTLFVVFPDTGTGCHVSGVMCGIGMKRPGSVWLLLEIGTVLFSRGILQVIRISFIHVHSMQSVDDKLLPAPVGIHEAMILLYEKDWTRIGNGWCSWNVVGFSSISVTLRSFVCQENVSAQDKRCWIWWRSDFACCWWLTRPWPPKRREPRSWRRKKPKREW